MSEDTRFKIFELAGQRLTAAAQEEAALHRSLSAAQAAELDEKISTLFAEHLRKFSPASRAAAIGLKGALSSSSGIRTADQAAGGANPGYANGGSACQNLTPDEEYDIEDGCEDDGEVYDLETCGCDPPPDGGGGGGDQDTMPSVTFSGPSSVAQGGTATFDVTTSKVSQSQPVQLTLTTLEGSGSAAFPGNQTSMSITGPGPILISGVSASSMADNIKLDGSAFFEGGNYSVATTGPLTFSVTPPPPTLTSATPLWFFGSGIVPPATFTAGGIQSVITAGSASGGSFDWTIAQGTAELSFASGKQQSTTTTSSNSVTVYTIGRSQSKNDVIVRLIWTPQNSVSAVPASLPLSIDSPYLLTQLSSTGPTAVADCTVHAAGNVGWWSQYKWWEFSFFGVQVFGASINENFANQTEYQANNWDFTPNGSPGVSGQSTFIDNFCFANQTAANPKTAQPDNPLGNNEVDSATQTYSVGSTTVGAAIPVQTQTLSRYVDHATVTNITTPVANQ